ncbi:ATP-dependent helicase [Nocardia colli]|uniref:ATP-dependent helicase n=1 Tax=Nocardia colli TaxID=2545717 RepID=UPI0035D625CB
MNRPAQIAPALARGLEGLNLDQQEVVQANGNLVVLAGPGSGKTRTLAAKVAHLLESDVSDWRALAAITYTRHAAREIVDRVRRLGLEPGNQLVCNTVHGWCLSAILQPYGPLVGIGSPDLGVVIDDRSEPWINLLQSCFDEVGVGLDARYETIAIGKIRRRLAAGIPLDHNDPIVRASLLFDEKLLADGWWDFDAMVARSLQIVRDNPAIARLVAAKYQWLVIDEYQDLGPVLHELVLIMHATVRTGIIAFGDPDQTTMAFAGADPRFLRNLAATEGFQSPQLRINYRCGRAIIAASHTALEGRREHYPDPDRSDDGIVEPIFIAGGLDHHAEVVVHKIGELAEAGVPLHQIAILYPRKGPLLTAVRDALHDNGVGYRHERDDRLPSGELADFLRDCATRAIAGPQGQYAAVSSSDPIPIVEDLVQAYLRLRRHADLHPDRRVAQRRLIKMVASQDASLRVDVWLSEHVEALKLGEIARRSHDHRDRAAVSAFLKAGQRRGLKLGDIAAGAAQEGKVTLTTYHSAKGREWQVVILPGLIDGILPYRKPGVEDSALQPVEPRQFEQDRRLFYVGMTRARSAVILLYGPRWATDGPSRDPGISPFARDVLAHLNHEQY